MNKNIEKKTTKESYDGGKKSTGYFVQFESDLPIESSDQDAFGMKSYVESLSEFIKECRTPMTIAIQGAWGTGKTSLMQLVEEKLDPDDKKKEGKSKEIRVAFCTFNTWQYSQFNQQDNMAASFLNCFLAALAPKKEENNLDDHTSGNFQEVKSDSETGSNYIKNFLNNVAEENKDTVKKASHSLARIGVDKALGSEALRQFEAFIARIFKDNDSLGASLLKEKINTAVDNYLKKEQKDRYVFFIDDLDRLSPEKAVEILEVIKVFLDCDKCVFVLGIDYSVIANGIRAKYGDYIDESKARDFFDKIIQLPFRMPVSAYEIKGYVKGLLLNADKEIKKEFDKEKENLSKEIKEENFIPERVSELSDIIVATIGKNPRSIKRLINSFGLTLKVATKNGWFKREKHYNILFLFHCIQLSWEEIYNHILTKGEEFCENPIEFCEKFTERQRCSNELKDIYIHKPEKIKDEKFIQDVIDVFEKLESFIKKMLEVNCTKDDNIFELKLILSIVSMTAMNQKKSGVTVTSSRYNFNGREYFPGTPDSERKNQGWLGHDIIKKLVNDGKLDKDAVSNLITDLKTKPGYDKEHQGEIIVLADQCPVNKGKQIWNNESVGDIEKKHVYVTKYWGKECLKSLVDWINENYKNGEYVIKVLFNGKEF